MLKKGYAVTAGFTPCSYVLYYRCSFVLYGFNIVDSNYNADRYMNGHVSADGSVKGLLAFLGELCPLAKGVELAPLRGELAPLGVRYYWSGVRCQLSVCLLVSFVVRKSRRTRPQRHRRPQGRQVLASGVARTVDG